MIPENLKRHFLRGYCDGDGNVRFALIEGKSWYKCSVSFSNGSSQILTDIKEWLHNKYSCEGILYNHSTYFILSYEKALDAAKISKLLYFDSNIYLTRKYKKAIDMVNYRTNTELTGKGKIFLEV